MVTLPPFITSVPTASVVTLVRLTLAPMAKAKVVAPEELTVRAYPPLTVLLKFTAPLPVDRTVSAANVVTLPNVSVVLVVASVP